MTPEELQRKLKEIGKEIKPSLVAGMGKAVLNVESRAKQNCQPGSTPYYRAPHITGTLQRSITSQVKETGENVQGIVGTNMEYAQAVHDGTSNMPARPFVLDAIVQEQEKTEELMSQSIEEGLKKHVS